MKYARKMLSLLLVLMLVVSVLPAAVSAGGGERYVHSYEELVTELAKPHDPNNMNDCIIICPKDFTWPSEPVTLNLEVPQDVMLQLGSHLEPDLGNRWVIPANVTVNQHSNLEIAADGAELVIDGRWNGPFRGGIGLWPTYSNLCRVVVNGEFAPREMYMEGMSDLEVNGTLIVDYTMVAENLLLGPEARVQAADPGAAERCQLTVRKDLSCPSGAADIQVPVWISDGVTAVTEHRISGNLSMVYLYAAAPTVLTGGSMDIRSVHVHPGGSLKIDESCQVSAESVVAADGPMTLEGKLTMAIVSERNSYAKFKNLHIGPAGVLELPGTASVEMDAQEGRITGTGTIAASDKVDGVRRHPAAIYVSQNGYGEMLRDDSPECVDLRKQYIDDTIQLQRDWIIDVPEGTTCELNIRVTGGTADVIFGAGDTYYENGDRFPLVNGADYLLIIRNIQPGHRLNDVLGNGGGISHGLGGHQGEFVTFLEVSDFYKDGVMDLEIALGPIPENPEQVADVEAVVVQDGYGEDSDTVTVTGSEVFLVREIWLDNGRYCPEFWVDGYWEYSLDGSSWTSLYPNRYYNVLPISDSDCLKKYDFINGQCYLRFRMMNPYGWVAMPTDPMYSQVIHLNPDKPVLGGGEPSNPDFTDVPANAYYANAVEWAVDTGITGGTGPNTFGPNDPCTRAHAVSFIWKLYGSPEPQNLDIPFWDVPEGAYYTKPVLWAVENNVTGGMGGGKFGVGDPCTRAQIVSFLWSAAGKPKATIENPFRDVAPGKYYEQAVLWAVENGITTGTGDDTFAPDQVCTRGQIVCFLHKTPR